MAIDFQGVKFIFIKVEGGAVSIDSDMTEKKFNTTKPQGTYRCIKFSNQFVDYFLKFGYKTLQNLSSIEENEIWDKINRDTFLGYELHEKSLFINASSYYGLKDPDLKTDGELPYSGQMAWIQVSVEASKTSDSILTLKQTDGTDAYLKLDPSTAWTTSQPNGLASMEYPPASVVSKRKSVLDATYFERGITLWAKSPEDNTPIMVNNCILTNIKSKLSTDKRFYGDPAVKFAYQQSSAYCKKVVYFEDTSTTTYAPLLSVAAAYLVKNHTGVKSIEYTYTKNLTDILASGESLTFAVTIPNRYFWGDSESSAGFRRTKNKLSFGTNLLISSGEIREIYKEIGTNPKKGLASDLISLDTRKPFVLSESNFITNIFKVLRGSSINMYDDANPTFENIPDGFIILIHTGGGSKAKIYRFKEGDSVKSKSVTSSDEVVEVSGTTSFGTEAKFRNNAPATVVISKDDVINATGFSRDTNPLLTFPASSVPIITIMRI